MSNSRLLLAIVTLCSACGGSSFEAGGSGGSSGSTADAGTTGSNAGATSSAGDTSGGSAGESSAGAGGHAAGGAATAGAGGSSAGGSSAGGSSAGAGGASAGAGGSAGAADCTTLKADYAAALELARVCDKGSTNQCSASSTLSTLGGCACPTLVNAKSEATTLAKQKYQAFQDAKCPIGPVCNIACPAYTGATCSAAATGNTFVCTASRAVVPTN